MKTFVKNIVSSITVLSSFLVFVYAECDVVSKEGWGGLDPVRVKYLARPVDLVIIQHTATAMCTSDAACTATLRSIQEYHMDQLNYYDIGSSFYVGGNAKVYEGVGWFHEGAHTYKYNSRSIGISFIGNYNNDTPTTEMLNAVKALLKCGVEKGHLTSTYHVVGHKQLIATESPGRRLYNKIRAWPEWMEDITSIKS